ncbi:MAG: penicillin-binding protein [Frankiales bacterium]|jgi:peptidoglycan glycosyltransferase|nr:penicillin-binding protein [Frankiales bacterium]
MNRAVRRLSVACLLLFFALIANANILQVVDAKSLRNNPHNSRVLLRTYSRPRGQIVVGGAAVASSVVTQDRLKYQRTYPQGPEYAPITGYYSLTEAATGIERAENSVLSGEDDRLFVRRLQDLLSGRSSRGGSVVLTINRAAQDAAYTGLKGQAGAVVALDPRSGKILALASSPSYDPSRLTSHDTAAVATAWKALNADPANPLVDRALSSTYPPGSLFKVVTSAAALAGGDTPATVIPAPHQLTLPQTSNPLNNFGNEVCAKSGQMTLADALRISCNTAFGALGLKLGPAALKTQADAFGLDDPSLTVPIPTATSVFPPNLQPNWQTAQAAIGQFDVRITPVQAAMIAAAVANKGTLMKPYLVDQILGPDLTVVSQTKPQVVRQSVSPQVAAALTQMMIGVVANGTGTSAQISGVQVAGKTGTAQHGANTTPHAWFIAFAPAQNPVVAVAVLVENGGALGSEATGGKVAAPIAAQVIKAVLHR